MSNLQRAVSLVVVVLLAACSSSSTSGAYEDAGSLGDESTDARILPRADGSVSLLLTSPTTGRCAPGSHWINVPFTASHSPGTTAGTQGLLAVDGENQMMVTCTVMAQHGIFDLTATLTSPAVDSMGNPVAPTTVSFRSTIAEDQPTSSGSVTVQDDLTIAGYMAASCLFSIHPKTDAEHLGIAPGRIWASVTCESLRDPASSDSMDSCALDPGFFVLENCQF